MGGLTESLMELIGELEARLGELDEKIEGLRALLARLPAKTGCTPDYRWVRGNGGIYYYWYLVCYEDGRRRHYYLGKQLPENIVREREAAARAKLLARRIKRLYTARFKAEEKLRRAEELLREAMAIIERALEEAGDAEAVGEKLEARGG